MYGPLADLLVAVHFLFVAFVVLGGLLVLRWPRLAWAHLPAAAWGAFVEVTGRICPLTPIENSWRAVAGGPGYEGDFIERYIVPVIYPPGLTPTIQLAFGTAVVIANAIIYALLWRRTRNPGRLSL